MACSDGNRLKRTVRSEKLRFACRSVSWNTAGSFACCPRPAGACCAGRSALPGATGGLVGREAAGDGAALTDGI